MQSSTDAGNGGPRKYTQSTAQQQQQQKQSEISETTSFSINSNNQPQQQQPHSGDSSSTPSKNPFKQQLDSNQQNGNMDQDCGILGVGKEKPPPPPPPTYQSQSFGGRQPPPADQYRQEDPRAAGSWSAAKSWMVSWRGSNRLVLVIVAIALLLDNMLLTTVVPIIPEFLYDIRHPDAPLDSYARTPLTFNTPPPPTPCPCNKDGSEAAPLEVSTLSPEENETYYRELEERHNELVGETVEVGLLFASKAFVQLLVNPIVGPLTHRIGYSIPMFAGFVIMFLSTLIFAFGRSYLVLFVARALQGIGSSCSSVSGMGMLADRFTDDKERGNAMGIALGGLALGVLIGPPFGGVMYEFVGKSAPFLVLAALALGDGLLQLFMLQPSIQKAESEPPSLKSLISDPYILIAAGAITFANMGIAMLEPSLPLWMVDNMGATRWEQGVAFLPASISYLIGTNLFGPLGHKIGRWFAACLGLVIIGGCLIFIPMATSITHLIIPNAGLGFAIGMVDSSMMPELGYLVDIRHSAVYGSVYALGDVAFCVGFAVGPALSGSLVKSIGFEWMLFGIAILCFMYAPLLTLLKNPPTSDEKKVRMAREAAEAAAAEAAAAAADSQVTASCPAIMHGTSVPPATDNVDAEAGRTNEGYESERL
ncbi:synaptic vesicular amine transporter isoform X1 [Drosophila bipectinata]|uniref:synaptic vesicular amine transporter isoform X1 n=1 Tax=Drosophila bipectinata TaxID=42026 RepID=UPI001C8AB9B7|nr:synaptic vesicular amine transporter isoform X1 [Drosophila bipectinata]XP_017090761.2 synaptic vesicular amine transporter isoform X1 [Drosophila bipectinata]XP_017090762.2 synaptic vesicular amine transporter isoform X1 [Drosophila bipectinata]